MIDGELTLMTTAGWPDAAIIPASVFVLTPDVPYGKARFDAALTPAKVVVPLVKSSKAPAMSVTTSSAFFVTIAAFATTVATPPDGVVVTVVGDGMTVVADGDMTDPVLIEKLPSGPVAVDPGTSLSLERAKAFAPAKTPAASATAPTPSNGLSAKACATPATIADDFKRLYATINVLMSAIVAATPAAIFDVTKMPAITPATTIKTSLYSITVSITVRTFLPHSMADFCDLVKAVFKLSPWPVKPSTKL